MKASSEAIRDLVFYQIFLRAFTPEGTLNAAAKLLTHVADLGVDVICLTSVCPADDSPDGWEKRQIDSGMNNPKSPFRALDFYGIDPEYGTEEDFRAFIHTAHQLGMQVVLDLTYTHCGPNAAFLENHPEAIDKKPLTAKNSTRSPKINFKNQEICDYLLQNAQNILEEYEIDGFRCIKTADAPMEFWENLRELALEYDRTIWMMADNANLKCQNYAFDVNENAEWSKTLRKILTQKASATLLQNAVNAELTDKALDVQFAATHAVDTLDLVDADGTKRLEATLPDGAMDAALLLAVTLPGVPFIYNGQEIADDAQHSIWSNRFSARNLHIDWSKAIIEKGKKRLETLKQFLEIRHDTEALSQGTILWLANSTPDSVLSFLRFPQDLADACHCDDDDCDCGDDDCDCGCHDHDDCHCDDDCQDDDWDDDDDCGCGHDHEHEHEHEMTSALVVVNLSDKPLTTDVPLSLERGTLLNIKLLKGADYKPMIDHIRLNMLPFAYAIIEF